MYNKNQLFMSKMSSVVGMLTLIACDQGLLAVLWQDEKLMDEEMCIEQDEHPILLAAKQQLQQYFLGQRQVFDVPLIMHGTAFQLQVWQALQQIPFGQTRSYQQIAQQIGRPKAMRAVGLANKNNPLSIIVPCHRVIGKSGKLVGFAGGLNTKQILLDLEHTI